MKPYPLLLSLTALALIGYLLLPRLTVRWQPGTGEANLSVRYAWAGAAPDALEQQVTAPLEAAFALVRDVEEITSVSRAGRGSINLKLRRGADGDFVRFNVASQIRRLYPELPAEVGYPTLDYASAENEKLTDLPVMTYTLSGPDPPTELYRYATEQLAPRLSLLRGLNRLEVTGGNRPHWRISLRPEALAAAGLTPAGIQGYLRQYFERSGLGFMLSGKEKLYAYNDVPTETSSLTATEWAAIPLPTTGGRQLTLGDLASIDRVPLPARAYYRINGENSIRLLAYATEDANRIALARELSTRVRALTTSASDQISGEAGNGILPPGYQLFLEDDATRFLREELAKTRKRTALSMGILLLFVLLAYRSFRRLGVVLFSLAVNLGLAFLCYWFFGVELNLYAFAGIAVSFGIMVDNVIIVIDGLGRKGGPLPPAVIGATLTTLAGLSVIWFLSDELRTQLYELARVMAINLSTSVLVALTLVPALVKEQGKGQPPTSGSQIKYPKSNIAYRISSLYQRLLTLLLRFRKTTLLLVILAFGLPLWWLPNRVDDWPIYNETIGSDFYRDQLRPHLNKYLGGSFRLFSYYVYEGSGYRPAEETRLYVGAALPDGATLEQLNQVVTQVEAYLGRFPDKIDRFTAQVYSGQNARIEITFPDGGRGGFPYTLKNRLTAYATNFGGVKWNIYGVGQGYSNDASGRPVSFNVTLKGYNQAGLDAQSGRLASLLLKHPRVQEVNTDANLNWWEKDRYEYLLRSRPEDLALRGIAPNELRASLAWFDQNAQPDFYLRGGEPVALVAENADRYDRWRLENWSIPRDTGQLNFPEVATLEKRLAPQALHKEDQQYLRLVAFEYLGSPRFGNKHLNACLDTLRAELPLGFTAERRSYSRDKQAKEMTALMGLAVLLIFFICAVLFESLRQAFNIVLLIPISCIGIFLTFYWFNVRLDQGGYVSFLLVTGLAVNGLILVINEYNYLRKQASATTPVQLYATAIRHKITPIVLTVISTAAGLIPFLLGGRNEVFWHALAAGTIGGLVFSVIVILFVSPVFFLRREVVPPTSVGGKQEPEA
ncbi:efflux RND transporter permease subunit [Neolewinella agarilytica]|uniref:Multidrug efflux pump subunit AcrB n=1 Tax=Neolewinella agarilytica TaxID=478744 RepID=A0A1H9LPE9_9BACT|nr:efflux RND transporter permease subunit [Neolewinella agarilytica]SER13025.1 Multidrug efflux pump subunit AcrB [Neolewinella agarilytica]